MAKKISKCRCGVKAHIDWTPVVDLSNESYQMCLIQCMSCDTDVSININTENINTLEIEEGVINLWNLISEK